jgi:hypothetical protein
MLLRAAMMLAAGGLTLAACDDDNGGSDTTPCNLDTGASSITGNLAVHYEASTTGNGTLSSITYATDAGDLVVTSPTLPWEIDVTLVTAPARVRAVGAVSNGSIEIQYQADGGPGNVQQGENTCSAD